MFSRPSYTVQHFKSLQLNIKWNKFKYPVEFYKFKDLQLALQKLLAVF